jgi:hypothetical protein
MAPPAPGAILSRRLKAAINALPDTQVSFCFCRDDTKDDISVECTECGLWMHLGCVGEDGADIEEDADWLCRLCSEKNYYGESHIQYVRDLVQQK